jgi:hypothetical protein
LYLLLLADEELDVKEELADDWLKLKELLTVGLIGVTGVAERLGVPYGNCFGNGGGAIGLDGVVGRKLPLLANNDGCLLFIFRFDIIEFHKSGWIISIL